MSNLQTFFNDTLTDMLIASPAVKNLHPLLRKLLEKNLQKGDEKTKQNVLRILLKESHDYVDLAQQMQKKYGINPEEYVQKLESWVKQTVREDNEKNEQKTAERKIKKSFA